MNMHMVKLPSGRYIVVEDIESIEQWGTDTLIAMRSGRTHMVHDTTIEVVRHAIYTGEWLRYGLT